MVKKNLVINVGMDPTIDPKPAWKAVRLAEAATAQGLRVELQLGGDAVNAAFLPQIAPTVEGANLVSSLEQKETREYALTL